MVEPIISHLRNDVQKLLPLSTVMTTRLDISLLLLSHCSCQSWPHDGYGHKQSSRWDGECSATIKDNDRNLFGTSQMPKSRNLDYHPEILLIDLISQKDLPLLEAVAISHRPDGHGHPTLRTLHLHKRDSNPPPSRNGRLNFTQNANVTRVTINSPPINLLTVELISDLHDFLVWTQPGFFKTTPKVVIFSSAIPDFFMSHFDLSNLILSTPTGQAALTQLVTCGRLLQSITSTAFIAEINGRTFGGGQELSAQMDMRFAGPNALISQYENSAGFVAQAGGQLFLGSIIGKARAMEQLLASKQIDAQTGTNLGLFNNNFRDANTLRSEVDALAARIGLFPQAALNDTKHTLRYLSPTPEQLDQQIVDFTPIGTSTSSQESIREILGDSDELANDYERGIPNSVVLGLYGQQLRAMPDHGQSVLDAADSTDRVMGWQRHPN
ncbi:MAG: hypothetical protein Q9170_003209 [Blastenia crenularia]